MERQIIEVDNCEMDSEARSLIIKKSKMPAELVGKLAIKVKLTPAGGGRTFNLVDIEYKAGTDRFTEGTPENVARWIYAGDMSNWKLIVVNS